MGLPGAAGGAPAGCSESGVLPSSPGVLLLHNLLSAVIWPCSNSFSSHILNNGTDRIMQTGLLLP